MQSSACQKDLIHTFIWASYIPCFHWSWKRIYLYIFSPSSSLSLVHHWLRHVVFLFLLVVTGYVMSEGLLGTGCYRTGVRSCAREYQHCRSIIMTTSGIMVKTTSPPRSWEPGRPVTVWLEPACRTVSTMKSSNLDLFSDEGKIVTQILLRRSILLCNIECNKFHLTSLMLFLE